MAQFKKYMHIERLGTKEVEGILVGDCYIFSKIDGANGSVWMDESGTIKCGSRNRELSENVNNRGFTQWVKKNEAKFKKLFTENVTISRVFGEWLVPHVIKYYDKSKYENFYVFDVKDTGDKYVEYDMYKPWLEACKIDYIPLIRKITDPTVDDLNGVVLKDNRFLIGENGNDSCLGEGIVIKNYKFLNRFRRVCWAKLLAPDALEENPAVAEASNGDKKNTEKENHVCKASVEDRIVEKYAPDHFIDKMIAILVSGDRKIKQEEIKEEIYTEFLKEEAKDFLVEFDDVKIHPRALRTKIYSKVDGRIALYEKAADANETNKTDIQQNKLDEDTKINAEVLKKTKTSHKNASGLRETPSMQESVKRNESASGLLEFFEMCEVYS